MLTRIAVTVVAVLSLAACMAGADPSASPSATESPSTSPSASPTLETSPTPSATSSDSPTATAALDCPPWDDGYHPDGPAAIDFHRYAGMCVGMSFAEASDTFAGPPLVGEASCPWVATIVASGDLYISAISDPAAPGDEILFFHAIYYEDPAAAVEVPTTAEGITIGSSGPEVYGAYPSAFENAFEDVSRGPRTQIVVPGPAGMGLVFDLRDGLVWEITWGEGLDDGVSGEFCAT